LYWRKLAHGEEYERIRAKQKTPPAMIKARREDDIRQAAADQLTAALEKQRERWGFI
jgi:hypothetical protein